MKPQLLSCLKLFPIAICFMAKASFSYAGFEEHILEHDPRWDGALQVQLQANGTLLAKEGDSLCTELDEQSRLWLKVSLPADRAQDVNVAKIPYAEDACTLDGCPWSDGFPYELDDLYLATPSMLDGFKHQKITTHTSNDVVHRLIKTGGKPYQRVCLNKQAVRSNENSTFELTGKYAGKLLALWLVGKVTNDQLVDFKNGMFSEAIQHYGMLEAHVSFATDSVKFLQTHFDFSPQLSNCLVAATYGLGYLISHGSVNAIDPGNLNFKNSADFFLPGAMVGAGIECADMSIVTPYISEWFSKSSDSQQSEMSALISEIFKGPGLLAALITTEGFFNPEGISVLLAKTRIKTSINTKVFINRYARKKFTDQRGLEFLVDLVGAMAFEGTVDSFGGASTSIFMGEYYKQMGQDQFRWQSAVPDGASYVDTASYLVLSAVAWHVLEGVVNFPERAKLIPAIAGIFNNASPVFLSSFAGRLWSDIGSLAGGVGKIGSYLHSTFVPATPFVSKSLGLGAVTNFAKGGAMYVGVNYFGNYIVVPQVTRFNRHLVKNTQRGSLMRRFVQSGVMFTIHYSMVKK
ncbi:hypothetical protein EOPP23_05550 [Endozoicomonas sp. OPT23]|uniref:hypothetical protein n=1 Tax=Endozoicomonas sp. OPT23 TaxID=2072845 RepID=UPI00129A1E42|nr:hypothetical protein [Endozoicomonas sp. OPT23]MRI32449.1 hypothetical protein [Endozoicomonas sp. OPT23]